MCTRPTLHSTVSLTHLKDWGNARQAYEQAIALEKYVLHAPLHSCTLQQASRVVRGMPIGVMLHW